MDNDDKSNDKSNDTKSSNNISDHDKQHKHRKKRLWRRNSPDLKREVYVCIDVARPRQKRVRTRADNNRQYPSQRRILERTSSPLGQSQQYCGAGKEDRQKNINSKSPERQQQSERRDLEVTPLLRNIRNPRATASIKRSISSLFLGGYGDDAHATDEPYSSTFTFPDLGSLDSNDSNANGMQNIMTMSDTSLTPPKQYRRKRIQEQKQKQKKFCIAPPDYGHAPYDDIMKAMAFESSQHNPNLDKIRLELEEDGSSNDHPRDTGRNDVDYGAGTEFHGHDQRITEMDDDASVVTPTSLAVNDEYNSVVIRISQNDGGEIVLEYPDSTPETLKATNNVNQCVDGNCHDNKTTATKANESCLEDSSTGSFSSDQSILDEIKDYVVTPQNSPTITTTTTTPTTTTTTTMKSKEPSRSHTRGRIRRNSNDCLIDPAFELTPTIDKSKEDEIEKELIACFKANKEKLTTLNYPVSDLILAEVTEQQNKCDNNGSSRSGDEDNKKPAPKFKFDFPNFINLRAKKTNPDHEASTEISKPQHKIVKRLKLSERDEIHVSPCQCALSLMGMRGVTPLDSQVISANDGESMFNNFFSILKSPSDSKTVVGGGFLKFPFFGKGNGAVKGGLTKKTNDCDNDEPSGSNSSVTPLNLSKKDKGVRSGIKLSLTKKEVDKKELGKMVRTKSAQAADAQDNNKKNNPKKVFMRSRQSSGVDWSLAQTESGYQDKGAIVDKLQQEQQSHSEHSAVRPDNRWDYESVGYHEITLIRNRIDDNNDINDVISHAKGGYIDWDAVTIRCPNHDELDILVQSLQAASCATIVPFSSNPKEKLKSNAMRIMECPQKTITKPELSVIIGDGSHLNGGNEPKSNINVNLNDITTHITEDGLNSSDAPVTKKCGDTSLQKNVSTSHTEGDVTSAKQFIKNIPWDYHFNKKKYCELCDLHFTLLTRRHHCRKCERSCCSHCSSVLLVKGGGEKRYCNRCSADILRIQSEALHKRLRKRISETVLPGKVHPACHRLGVGVIGKLPHWKNYTSFSVERRPAVGRLTVEIVEAMALPSVDKVHGIVDPYVRATITGYDRDLFWYLREWLPCKRFSMCSGYCTSTVSPIWRGCGRSGGERLTLPVISTAGAVLRLEVLHYNVMTNARGKDSVLGIVEIPLSDLPNANMRHMEGLDIESSKDKSFDGYCDRWYRLLPVDHAKSNVVILSKPIASPHSKKNSGKGKEFPGNKVMKSLEEIGKRVQGLCIAPVEWFASAIKLDLPARRPEAICEEHKARSTIHVRIKLNASHVGDLLSHAWYPPVKLHPSAPPFDPQLVLNRIQQIIKLVEPYHVIFQYIEEVIKWKHETKICLKAYCVFAFHMIVLPHLVYLIHIYLVIFLGIRLRRMNADASDTHTDENSLSDAHMDEDSLSDAHMDEDSHSDQSIQQVQSIDSEDSDVSVQSPASPTLDPSDQYVEFHNSPSLGEELNLSDKELPSSKPGRQCKPTLKSNPPSDIDEEDTAKLNKAVIWLAKRLAHNKGLDILQFKLTMVERDIRNVSSVWDGSNRLLTQTAIVCIIISFILHFLVSRRVLWLVGASVWYFAQATASKLYARAFLGFWRGVAKTTRRQHLLDAEILEVAGVKSIQSAQ